MTKKEYAIYFVLFSKYFGNVSFYSFNWNLYHFNFMSQSNCIAQLNQSLAFLTFEHNTTAHFRHGPQYEWHPQWVGQVILSA